jgi:hypothetical protein
MNFGSQHWTYHGGCSKNLSLPSLFLIWFEWGSTKGRFGFQKTTMVCNDIVHFFPLKFVLNPFRLGPTRGQFVLFKKTNNKNRGIQWYCTPFLMGAPWLDGLLFEFGPYQLTWCEGKLHIDCLCLVHRFSEINISNLKSITILAMWVSSMTLEYVNYILCPS